MFQEADFSDQVSVCQDHAFSTSLIALMWSFLQVVGQQEGRPMLMVQSVSDRAPRLSNKSLLQEWLQDPPCC